MIDGFFGQGGFIAQQTQTYDLKNNGGIQDGTRLSRIGPVFRSEFDTHNPLFGEGFGTRQTGRGIAHPAQTLDDQWFGTLLETGILGVIAWIWLFVIIVRRLGRRAKLETGTREGWLPVALAAAIGGYAVSMATYDAFTFIQATFLLFILIGCASSLLQLPPASAEEIHATTPSARPVLQHA